MNGIDSGRSAGGEKRTNGKRAIARGAADWLHLAATPVFTFMTLLTVVQNADAHRMACPGMADTSLLGGMGFMYLLMSVFHAAPWVKLAVRSR